jgi:DNA-binding response OmpR family regulator
MKVLLADDDRDLVDILSFVFQRDGYHVVTAYDGLAALRVFETESPDLVVLDLHMPKRSGTEVLEAIRTRDATPVLVLSVITDEDQVVDALDKGADDYLEKPFRPRELRARARALTRRARNHIAPDSRQPLPLVRGDVRLDTHLHQVTIAGRLVRLTPTEFGLLSLLMRNYGIVIAPSTIVANVWGYDAEENEDVVRVTISRLRRKIEPYPSRPVYIVNVPGVGYRFEYPTPEP